MSSRPSLSSSGRPFEWGGTSLDFLGQAIQKVGKPVLSLSTAFRKDSDPLSVPLRRWRWPPVATCPPGPLSCWGSSSSGPPGPSRSTRSLGVGRVVLRKPRPAARCWFTAHPIRGPQECPFLSGFEYDCWEVDQVGLWWGRRRKPLGGSPPVPNTLQNGHPFVLLNLQPL